MGSFTIKRTLITGIALGVTILSIVMLAKTGPNTTTPAPTISEGANAIYPAGLNDYRVLIGQSHYVCVGRIAHQTGNKLVGGLAATEYAVDVIKNINGTLNGEVIVVQSGVSYKNGKLTSYNGDGVLVAGGTYLFAARFDVKDNFHVISVPPYDRRLLTTDTTLSSAQLLGIANSDSTVIAFEKA